MELKILSTGSKGNAYILRNDNASILLDAGVPYNAILNGLDYRLNTLKVALVTHKHKDHSMAMDDLQAHGIPVWSPMTKMTRIKVQGWIIAHFQSYHDVPCWGFQVMGVKTRHRIVYATDTYKLPYVFPNTTHYILECNYCPDILLQQVEQGIIPRAHAKRVMQTHLGLETASKFFAEQDLSACRKIILTHLSDGNSDAEMIQDTIRKQTGVETIVAEKGMTINMDLYEF